jgi:hypothetical protein
MVRLTKKKQKLSSPEEYEVIPDLYILSNEQLLAQKQSKQSELKWEKFSIISDLSYSAINLKKTNAE